MRSGKQDFPKAVIMPYFQIIYGNGKCSQNVHLTKRFLVDDELRHYIGCPEVSELSTFC